MVNSKRLICQSNAHPLMKMRPNAAKAPQPTKR